MRCTAAKALSPRMTRACTSPLAPPKQSTASRFAGLLERSRRSPLWPPTNSIPCSKVRELCPLAASSQHTPRAPLLPQPHRDEPEGREIEFPGSPHLHKKFTIVSSALRPSHRFGFDRKNQLFVAALGNNSVEVIDISARTRVYSIGAIPNPQGVVFAPESMKLFAASSKGRLYIYNAATFGLIKTIDFHSDVDNLRYDASNQRVYVGYGEDETGALGTVDAKTNGRLDEEYKLGAHPESFQLETAGPNIYVNLPDLKQIAVIDPKTRAVTRWPMKLEHNCPMALDEANHRLFVATHEPARLAVIDTTSGHSVATLPCVQDADDVYYDSGRKRVYVPGGEGYISVF